MPYIHTFIKGFEYFTAYTINLEHKKVSKLNYLMDENKLLHTILFILDASVKLSMKQALKVDFYIPTLGSILTLRSLLL